MKVRVTPLDMWVIQTLYDHIPSTQRFSSHKDTPYIGGQICNFQYNSLYRHYMYRCVKHLFWVWGWPHLICGSLGPHMIIFRQPSGLVAIITPPRYGVKLAYFQYNSLYRDYKYRCVEQLFWVSGWPHLICGSLGPHMTIFRQPSGLVAIKTPPT